MASASGSQQQLAVAGKRPGHIPVKNTFDWIFGEPFRVESEYTPRHNIVPSIEKSRPIFIDNKSDRALTHGQIKEDALTIATNLHALGLDPTDLHVLPPTPTCAHPEVAPVVLIQLPNCLPFAPILMGVFASGLTATLVSPALTSSEIAWILQNGRPGVIITAKTCLPAMREALGMQEDKAFFANTPVFTVDVANDVYPENSSQKAPTGTTADWSKLLSKPKRALLKSGHMPPESAPTRTAVILWSSGTSGRSKGVLLSHHALNFSAASLWHDADFYNGVRQRWIGFPPFYHVFGLCNILLLGISTGATVYTMSSFSLDVMLKTVPKRKITYLHMAPPVAAMLAKAAVVEPYAKRDANGKNAFSTVAGAVSGGAPLGHETIVHVYQRLGFRVRMGYGLSETCSTTVQHGLTEADMAAQAGDSGRPHWGVEVMIADPESPGKHPKALPINTAGEILIRAPDLMSAYLPFGGLLPGAHPDMAATLDAVTPDGWFHTGDIGNLNANGRLRITDRMKELIKVRAYQVAPAELEAILCSSDHVADAGVIGVHDDHEATEWPRAYVVAAGAEKSEEELRALALELKELVEKRTTKYKWLIGGIVFVQAVPKSPSGKILRRVLKEGKVKGFEVQLYKKKVRESKL